MHPDLAGFLLSIAGLAALAVGGLAMWARAVIRRLMERVRQAEAEANLRQSRWSKE